VIPTKRDRTLFLTAYRHSSPGTPRFRLQLDMRDAATNPARCERLWRYLHAGPTESSRKYLAV